MMKHLDSMNLPGFGARTLVRYRLGQRRTSGLKSALLSSWSLCVRKNERGLSMNLPSRSAGLRPAARWNAATRCGSQSRAPVTLPGSRSQCAILESSSLSMNRAVAQASRLRVQGASPPRRPNSQLRRLRYRAKRRITAPSRRVVAMCATRR